MGGGKRVGFDDDGRMVATGGADRRAGRPIVDFGFVVGAGGFPPGAASGGE